jgi:hypothetical protein
MGALTDPEDVMTLLRDYHAAIGEIIIKYSGNGDHGPSSQRSLEVLALALLFFGVLAPRPLNNLFPIVH